MKFYIVVISLVVLMTQCSTSSAESLTDLVQVCPRNDPTINQCIIKALNDLRPHLKKGIASINMPALEPLSIGNLNLLDDAGLTVVAKDVVVKGASNYEIKKIKTSQNLTHLDISLNLPALEITGKYLLSGQLFSLPLKGNGPFTANVSNFPALAKFIFQVKGNHMQAKEIVVKIGKGKGQIHFENLFNGDAILGDTINETINQNFGLYLEELKGPLERALSKKFTSITNKVLETIAIDELFA